MLKRLFLLTFLLFVAFRMEAQTVSKSVQRADKAFVENNYKKALEIYLKATSEEVVNAYLARQIGNCYRLQGDMNQAEIWYENALKQSDHTNLDFLLLGYAQKANGKDELSAASLSKLYTSQMLPNQNTSTLNAFSFVTYLRNGFLNFRIVPIGINSPEADFSPSICRDALVFATSRFDRELAHYKQINPQQHLNLYTAKLGSSGELGAPFIFSKDLLNQLYTGPIAFSPSCDTAYFVRKKYLKTQSGDGKQASDNNLKIYRAIYNQGQWIDQGPLNFCSDEYSMGDPAVSPDGKRLYFISDMPGGIGGTDIYFCEIRPNGTFGNAVNLGNKVNTSGNEMTPFVAKDGTLFFSSDTHPGLGNLDLFAAYPTPNGFDYVTNLGYPINGAYDDFGIVLNPKGDLAFFSSNRPNGAGDDDIYKFNIEKLTVTHTVDGQVVDEQGLPVAASTIKVIDGKTLINTLSTDFNGKFSLKIDDNHELNLQLERTDFFPATAKVSSVGLGLKSTQILLKVTMKRDAGYTLTGVILSATDGSPIASAQVIAYPPDTTKALIGNSDQLGRFSYKLANETDYRIRLSKEGFVSKWLTITTKNRERGEINLSALSDTKLTPNTKPGITGIISDAKTSLPITNAIVTISSPSFPQIIKLATAANGQFSQENLPEGSYTIVIEKEGYQPLNIPVILGKQPINLNSSFKMALEPMANSYTAVGLVTNKDGNAPIADVTVSLLDKATNEKIQKRTDEFGSFDFKVDPDHIYILRLEKEKFFAKTLMISTQGLSAGMLNLNTANDLKMEAIVMNKAIEIPNIYYDLGKATIKPEAAQELDKVVKLLLENPTIKIELSSHTDSRGDSKQNLLLSQKRAEAAADYITSKDIELARVIAKGYGDTMIKNRCKKGVQCSEQEHAANRRTEIKVISF
ncbi:MAG: carboxypeptidase regulatory-like domain-containing protein [Bacteroidales bacterium]|nr:carboxypeptidase regulatory-like domain-containing protein [Bacteroidales bacterium]